MNKKARKLSKKKSREKRLKQEKHLRHFGPTAGADDALADEVASDLPDLPSPVMTERAFRDMFGGRGGKKEKAQELAYDAMEAPDRASAVDLARQALAMDPNCADALSVLAHYTANSPEDEIRLLEQAVEAAERSLGGPRFFKQNAGHFWGLLETRPYMRARADLADALWLKGRQAEAIAHYEALLQLNPNDNQGIREFLLRCYFLIGNLDGVGRLLERYEQDCSAVFGYSRVLERLLAGDEEGARMARRVARNDNPYVERYLTGRKKMPRHSPPYYSPGEDSEAICCVGLLGVAWQRYPEAVAWLKGQA